MASWRVASAPLPEYHPTRRAVRVSAYSYSPTPSSSPLSPPPTATGSTTRCYCTRSSPPPSSSSSSLRCTPSQPLTAPCTPLHPLTLPHSPLSRPSPSHPPSPTLNRSLHPPLTPPLPPSQAKLAVLTVSSTPPTGEYGKQKMHYLTELSVENKRQYAPLACHTPIACCLHPLGMLRPL